VPSSTAAAHGVAPALSIALTLPLTMPARMTGFVDNLFSFGDALPDVHPFSGFDHALVDYSSRTMGTRVCSGTSFFEVCVIISIAQLIGELGKAAGHESRISAAPAQTLFE
jgi:hypothetical protein